MRWIFRLIALVIAIVVVAIIGISLVPAERIAEIATREVTKQTGRELTITGGVKPVFFPVIGVKTGPVKFANAEWSNDGPMVEAEEMLVGVELWPLFSGTVKIKEFRVERPVIRLEKNKNGVGNWELPALAASSEASETPNATGNSTVAAITLELGRINNGAISYVDAASGADYRLTGVNLTLRAPDFQGQATLEGEVIYREVPLQLEASLARLDQFISGAVSGVNLQAGGSFGQVSLVGDAGFSPTQASGRLEAEISDLPGMMRLLGQEAASFGRKASASGDVTYTKEGAIFLRNAAFGLDRNALRGDIDITTGSRTMITAKLDAGDVFLPESSGSSSQSSSATSEDGWSKARIDASGLGAVDADVVLRANSIDLGSAKLGASAIRAKLDQGRLVIALNDVNAYGGKIGGEYVLNARSGLSMGGTITAAGIRLQPLLVDVAEYDRLIAGADIRVKFLASGNSMDALMKSLSGDGSVKIGDGELLGLDIAGMLRNLDASYRGDGQKTIFDSVTGSFTMAGGILSNDDLKYASELVDATGKGTVNIGERRVKYRLVPVAFAKRGLEQAGGISVPVLIEGPWNRISYKPDLQSLFDAELEKQKKEAEEKLRGDVKRVETEAREKLQGEVDKAVEEAKQKLLDDLRKRLTGEE